MTPRFKSARVIISAFCSTINSNDVIFRSRAFKGTQRQFYTRLSACASRPCFPQGTKQISNNICRSAHKQHAEVLSCVTRVWPSSVIGVKRWFTSTNLLGDAEGDRSRDVTRRWTTKTVHLPVGGNGTVTLDISVLTEGRDQTERFPEQRQDLLIYLPPSTSLGATTMPLVPGGLRSSSSTNEYEALLSDVSMELEQSTSVPTVVKINYRLSPVTNHWDLSHDNRFPTPVHDVSVAFDWIFKNRDRLYSITVTEGQAQSPAVEKEEHEPRVLMFGSRIGGSLALMLVLTEPNKIHATAVHDPIVDWVGLDELAVSSTDIESLPASSKRRSRVRGEDTRAQTQKAANGLISVRTRLFRNPSGFFDAFASPLMFLRAPSRDTPLWRTAKPELEEITEDSQQMREALKHEGGIEISSLETREVIAERGYGPYDDDWHTAEPSVGTNRDIHVGLSDSHVDRHPSTQQQRTETDLSPLQPSPSAVVLESEDEDKVSQQLLTDQTPPLSQAATSSSISYSPSLSVSDYPPLTRRRRKVLRRWPPVGRPEDVDLPYTRIYSTLPTPLSELPERDSRSNDIGLAFVLHPQAKEMVDVMQRACFWGRQRSLSEERVGLVTIDSVPKEVDTQDETKDKQAGIKADVIRRAVDWFREIREVRK